MPNFRNFSVSDLYDLIVKWKLIAGPVIALVIMGAAWATTTQLQITSGKERIEEVSRRIEKKEANDREFQVYLQSWMREESKRRESEADHFAELRTDVKWLKEAYERDRRKQP